MFAAGWTDEAGRFEPQSIAARYDQLVELRGKASPTHALIVFRWQWEPALSAVDHENLWRWFGVPAFEQIISDRGELLAAECEAHDGLHIVSPHFAAGDHETDRSPCPCGRTSPRLVSHAARRTAVAGQ